MASPKPDHLWTRLIDLVDQQIVPPGWLEPVLSMLGGFFGILAVFMISSAFLGPLAAMPIVASMGASAVLLFAVPHGPLSQPWPVLGGHVFSALVGVASTQLIDSPIFAAPIAVGVAIFVMMLTHCLHPPGGATALTAVVAANSIGDLGYGYLFAPVLLNAVVILAVAVLFNMPFAWRRYPAGWHLNKLKGNEPPSPPDLSHLDFIAAVRELDTFIDIRDEDLIHIYQIATARKHSH